MNTRPAHAAFSANVRRLRGTATLDQVATAARRKGARWGTGRIADLEAGRASPTIDNLVMIAAAIGEVHGRPIPLHELVDDQFAPFLLGSPVILADVKEVGTEQEHRVARKLGITSDELADMADLLWQRSFVEERDARCPTDASTQKRGHIARTMMAEVRARLAQTIT